MSIEQRRGDRPITAAATAGHGRDLARLMVWLSPVFPVGAFSYSHAIEQAVHAGAITHRDSLVEWLSDLMHHGSLWNDSVLCAAAWRACLDPAALEEIAALAEAMAGSLERHRETMLQGEAFLAAVSAWPGDDPQRFAALPAAMAYPVAVGASAGRHDIAAGITATAFLQAYVANLVQVAMRLVPLGQQDGMRALAALEALILATASRAAVSTLDDLGGCTVRSEIFAMNHETLSTRLFRT